MSFSLIVYFFMVQVWNNDRIVQCLRTLQWWKPQMFKVQYTNVTLKGLKDQLDEINQGLNPEDTRRVKYIWYERPTLDDGRITFSRLELKNDDDVRSIFLIFWQHNMVVVIDMFVTLQRSTKDILNSLILPEDRDREDLVLKCQKIKRTQHVLCRISYISYDIEFLHIRWVSRNAHHSLCDDSSNMREFDVITYIADSA